MNRITRTALRSAAVAIAGAVLAASLWSYVVAISAKHRASPITDPIDLVAFYCGGRVLAEGNDPYLNEPLRSCERDALRESDIRMIPNLVVPAPLPPYALAAFGAAAVVPFRVASTCFFLASLLAIGLAIALAARASRVPAVAVALALGPTLVLGSLLIGQIVPFVTAALCASALAARANRPWTAAALASLAMVEPHVGLAALAGLFAARPRARVPVFACVAALLAVSLATAGLARNLEYAFVVLPAHARSEVSNFYAQYSLTALLYALGASADVALRAGEVSYAAMVVAGVVLARRLVRACGDGAFAVLTPAAFTLIGGVFMHAHQMAVALPFALLLARDAKRRAAVVAAIVLLAIPWQSVYEVFLYASFPAHAHGNAAAALAAAANPAWLADRTWQVWIDLIRTRDGRTPLELALFKAPTWIALAILAVAGFRAASRAPAARTPMRPRFATTRFGVPTRS